MPHRLHLEIISQEKQLLSQDVDMILAPSNLGQIGILPGHISLFASLDAGELIIITDSKHDVFAITGGFLDINQDQVTVLANSAIRAKDINVKKVEDAMKKALFELIEKHDLMQSWNNNYHTYKLNKDTLSNAQGTPVVSQWS